MPIVVVDDNSAHRYALKRKLEDGGFKTIEVGTGAEALAQAVASNPRLILLDLHLPDVSGLEVCRRLKSEAQTTHVPVVMFSAVDQTRTIVDDALQVGADAFLFFPMTDNELGAVVRGSIARASRQSRASQ